MVLRTHEGAAARKTTPPDRCPRARRVGRDAPRPRSLVAHTASTGAAPPTQGGRGGVFSLGASPGGAPVRVARQGDRAHGRRRCAPGAAKTTAGGAPDCAAPAPHRRGGGHRVADAQRRDHPHAARVLELHRDRALGRHRPHPRLPGAGCGDRARDLGAHRSGRGGPLGRAARPPDLARRAPERRPDARPPRPGQRPPLAEPPRAAAPDPDARWRLRVGGAWPGRGDRSRRNRTLPRSPLFHRERRGGWRRRLRISPTS